MLADRWVDSMAQGLASSPQDRSAGQRLTVSGPSQLAGLCFRRNQLPGLAPKARLNSRAHFHPHVPSQPFSSSPGQGEV